MEHFKNLSTFLPLYLFIGINLTASIVLNDFYAVPVVVILLFSVVVAFIQFPKVKFETKLNAFAKGAGNENLLIMIVIFLLAGAFSEISKDLGAIDTIVSIALNFIDPRWIIAGLFLIAAFVSLSLGTSVGTIAALSPIAVGLSGAAEGMLPVGLAAVVGGAMFGDNLSLISDTAIAASRTQEVDMKEKFLYNFKMVLIPTIITFLLYLTFDVNGENFQGKNFDTDHYEWIKVVPYALVLVIGLAGVNVVWTLVAGIISSLGLGWYRGEFSLLESLQTLNKGISGMYELSVICLLIGGIVGIIQLNGGIDYLLKVLTKRADSPRKAEIGIVALTALVNTAIANNTITIIIVGPIAKQIADDHGIDRRKSASILDTISCFIQGGIPYGAQLLMAVSIASYAVSPFEIIRYLYYPFLIGIFTLLFILFFKRKSGRVNQKPPILF